MRCLLTSILLILFFPFLTGQSAMPEVLLKNSINEQIKYINEKTLIYEYYRAIREDMFQKLMTNFSDTLSARNATINNLNRTVAEAMRQIDTLKGDLEATKASLETAITTKNSIMLIGKEVNKSAYNSIMWLTVIILAGGLVILFLTFKRSLVITRNTEKELKDLKDEFLSYKKTAREAREKMSMDHFNELKKLRGG
jgi:hypothetical protein